MGACPEREIAQLPERPPMEKLRECLFKVTKPQFYSGTILVLRASALRKAGGHFVDVRSFENLLPPSVSCC